MSGTPRSEDARTAEQEIDKRDLLEVVDRRLRELSSHPEARVRDAVEELLTALDLVHRAGLTNLVRGIQSLAGEPFLNRLCQDTTVRLLLMSYDLIQVDRTIQAEEAMDEVRGHLHQHGIEVEILEVVGGVVYVRLHGVEAAGASLPEVRRDIESALRSGFLGFQQLELGPRPGGSTSGLLQLATRPLVRPSFVAVAELDELELDRLTPVIVDGTSVLLVRLTGHVDEGEGIRAFRNQCGDSPLPLEYGTREDSAVVCPWHGCRYDLRTGRRIDASGEAPLAMLPVRVEGSRVLVATGTKTSPAGDLD